MAGGREHLTAFAERFARRADAPSSQIAYLRELRRFLEWMPDEVGTDLLLDYRDHLRERGLARATVRWRVTVVRAFLTFCGERTLLAGRVELNLKLPKGHRGFVPRVLSAIELKRLLNTPDRRTWQGARDAAVLACLGLGGLRASEVCGLTLADITVGKAEIVLRVQGKGGKSRAVSLPLPGASAVRSWARRQERLGVVGWSLFSRAESRADQTLDAHAVRYIVRKYARESGLGNVSPHSLRHTEATRAIDRGMSLHRLQTRLGHSSLLMTANYLHVSPVG